MPFDFKAINNDPDCRQLDLLLDLLEKHEHTETQLFKQFVSSDTEDFLSASMPELTIQPARKLHQILLVEDTKVNILILNNFFKNSRFSDKFVIAENAEDAWEKLKNKNYHFSIVFIDEDMPGMQGTELALMIKLLWSNIPVISISSHADDLHNTYPDIFDGAVQKRWSNKQLFFDIIEKFFPNNLN